MSKKIKSAAVAAKAASNRRKAEIQMVEAIGGQLNQLVSTVASAAVESRRIDMEGLESKDRAAVLMSEGTTLVALVESNNQALSSMWQSLAPMLGAFLSQMAQVQATEAQARATEAQAELLRSEAEDRNSKTREVEAENSKFNAETERVKAKTARMRAEAELEAARERAESRRMGQKKAAPVNGVEVNDVW